MSEDMYNSTLRIIRSVIPKEEEFDENASYACDIRVHVYVLTD